MTAPALRWGVLGVGWIAERFAGSIQRNTRQRVAAVGSRDADRAAALAQRLGVTTSHGSYQSLVADPDVDVIYVATPHPAHLACARLALEAGKHVVVEKPLALNASEATELADLAGRRALFCMEALWSLFLPRFDVVRQVLQAGLLGEVRTVLADYGEFFTPDHRIMRADLAGGPLLDLGTYPVAFAHWVLGEIRQVVAVGQPYDAEVNGQLGAILGDGAGNLAVLHTTMRGLTPASASVVGTRATLTLPGVFCQPGDVVLTSADGARRLVWSESPIGHEGLFHEAAHAARCIADGLIESPIRPLADSVATLRVLDEIRRQLG